MDDKILVVVALVGVAWIAWSRHGVSSIMPTATNSGNVSTNVPWYLNYNTNPPVTAGIMATLPVQSVGINSQEGGPCPACSMFGLDYGAQY